MGTFRYQGADGKEYFNLTAQSGGVTTANDPEDFWAAEGTINFPYKFYNTATQKEESYLGDAIISSSSDDIVDVAIDGLDEDNKPIATTIKLNGTTEVKLLKKFYFNATNYMQETEVNKQEIFDIKNLFIIYLVLNI